ncbi:MAG: hypothetical protein J5545_04270 [Bacteroidaceae bacterium]|nr:hypothetical protein [Bacteroidaceae bacterium]
MGYNKFSFRGIKELCQRYNREIYMSSERAALKAVLDNRRVRFVSPLGTYDYAYFGEFTFEGDVMLLWTKKMEYTKFHRPSEMPNTMWSVVPVIFAGVDTRYKDDHYQEIFTGDVVTYKGYTSFVRYFGDCEVPGLAGDNCDVQFERNGEMHKEGTVFSGLTQSMFNEFAIEKLYWPTDQYVPYGISRVEVIERASQAKSNPTFADGYKPSIKGRQLAYEDISEVLRENDVLCYFVGEPCEDENGEETRDVYADNIPDDFSGEECDIALEISICENLIEAIKTSFDVFLFNAHNEPDKTFVLCDFRKALSISKIMEQKVALQFWSWYEYKIPNVILPFWILNKIAGYDMIGRD